MVQAMNLNILVRRNIITTYDVWVIENSDIDEAFRKNVEWLASSVSIPRLPRSVSAPSFAQAFLDIYEWIVKRVENSGIPLADEFDQSHINTFDFLAELFNDSMIVMGKLVESDLASRAFGEYLLPLLSTSLPSNDRTSLASFQAKLQAYISKLPAEDRESVMLLQVDIWAFFDAAGGTIKFYRIMQRIILYVLTLLDQRLDCARARLRKSNSYQEAVDIYERSALEKLSKWESAHG